MDLSYSTLFRVSMFSLGIGAAGLLNYLVGTESTVLILGGLCGVLLAKNYNRSKTDRFKQITMKIIAFVNRYLRRIKATILSWVKR